MSLTTPDKIRSLQRKLYGKAKAEPAYRFYRLYDKIHRPDMLAHAYALARDNDGAPGVDGVTFDAIEAAGLEEWLAALCEDLASRTYRPQPVRRVTIPKPGGGERPLGIPTIRDRVAQTAAKLVLEPIFEADLEDTAYGYRPKRSALDAVTATHRLIGRGYADVVDADLSKYFDTIPHRELMQSVARRICDPHVLRLIKLWLRVPVEERDGEGKRRMVGGKSNKQGTPQGGVISPLLANLYMNRFLKFWRTRGCSAAFRAHLVNYADDFVISRRMRSIRPAQLRSRRRGAGLDKSGDGQARAHPQRGEDLGEGRPHGKLRLPRLHAGAEVRPAGRTKVSGRKSIHEKRAAHQGQDRRSPDAAQQRFVAANTRATEPPVGGLVGVFQLWNPRSRVSGNRRLRRRSRPALPRQAAQGAWTGNAPVFPGPHLRGTRSDATHPTPQTQRRGPVVKSVGKPDAGNPHVRFDERGRETERLPKAQATAPFLDSTPAAKRRRF
jgi:group II intron reverse transcriptase/maturase